MLLHVVASCWDKVCAWGLRHLQVRVVAYMGTRWAHVLERGGCYEHPRVAGFLGAGRCVCGDHVGTCLCMCWQAVGKSKVKLRAGVCTVLAGCSQHSCEFCCVQPDFVTISVAFCSSPCA